MTANIASICFSEFYMEEKNYPAREPVSWNWGTKLELCGQYGIEDLSKDRSLGWMEIDGYISLFCRANNVHFFGDNHAFFELIQNCSLQYLDLGCSFLTHSEVKLLCDVLNQAECNIEKLV